MMHALDSRDPIDEELVETVLRETEHPDSLIPWIGTQENSVVAVLDGQIGLELSLQPEPVNQAFLLVRFPSLTDQVHSIPLGSDEAMRIVRVVAERAIPRPKMSQMVASSACSLLKEMRDSDDEMSELQAGLSSKLENLQGTMARLKESRDEQ